MWERAQKLWGGEPATWSPALRTVLNVCVASPTPMVVWWGPSSTQLCNDAAIAELDAWADEYPALLSEVERVKATGEPTRVGSLTLVLTLVPLFDVDHSVAGAEL